MGIITRFRDVMAANFNALLDKCEDPQKMIDQYLRDLEKDFGNVRAETASIMADEKAARRKLDECQEEMNKMAEYAKKAVTAGNDGDAKEFLRKKSELAAQMEVLTANYTAACENSKKMKQMHDKLQGDIAELKSRRDMLSAKSKVAETQAKLNKMGSSASDAGATMSAFDKMEEKINKQLDEQNAMAELNSTVEADTADSLIEKYEQESKDTDVDAELAALKAEMGM